jgi:phosphoenolpyruvate synthase/pyruvate phosphate dikinase
MKYNGFFERVRTMMANTEFQTILEVREDMLKDLRKDVKESEMPQWMLDALQEMHNSFSVNSSVRVRSSTNNEDLPGFSGAGLYDSKTQ